MSHWRKVKQHGETERYGDTSYVASVGTCQGDSGGPAFVEEKPNHFVVTGSGNNFNQIYAGGGRFSPTLTYYTSVCVQIFGRVNNFSRTCERWSRRTRRMRRNQQSNPLCEVQKVHSMGHREHAEERSVGQTQSFQDCSTSSSSSGRSFALTWTSKSSERERAHRRAWVLFFVVEFLRIYVSHWVNLCRNSYFYYLYQ